MSNSDFLSDVQAQPDLLEVALRAHLAAGSQLEIAAKACFREAMRKAGPTILEPVMKVEVVTPENHLGDVIGDVNRRRGEIEGQLSRGANLAIEAKVPLSEMFGYIGDLRSMTSGRATFTMEFSHYQPAPRNVQDDIVKKAG